MEDLAMKLRPEVETALERLWEKLDTTPEAGFTDEALKLVRLGVEMGLGAAVEAVTKSVVGRECSAVRMVTAREVLRGD
jgi:hypothetical protein